MENNKNKNRTNVEFNENISLVDYLSLVKEEEQLEQTEDFSTHYNDQKKNNLFLLCLTMFFVILISISSITIYKKISIQRAEEQKIKEIKEIVPQILQQPEEQPTDSLEEIVGQSFNSAQEIISFLKENEALKESLSEEEIKQLEGVFNFSSDLIDFLEKKQGE